ncbi:MAG: PhzF family phenazine biosynthesis protein [Thermodesulfobacteriota bacterium]|nr:PhzF family phenazine biosynthesis protein [Thermodesulfobacteriota bacterium]
MFFQLDNSGLPVLHMCCASESGKEHEKHKHAKGAFIMELTLYQIDAFASKPFEGNPAAVCLLERWIPDALLQAIAEENNLSETAFLVPQGKKVHIRWFTPVTEVDLCGHATLASAYVLFKLMGHEKEKIIFESKSGELIVFCESEWLVMDFPSQPPVLCDTPEGMVKAFGRNPLEVLKSEDYLAVFETEEVIRSLEPDYDLLKRLDLRGVIATARGDCVDFVSRFFAPKYGIDEDPVTGSAHCALTPYWANTLNKSKFIAKQVSKRGGELICELKDDRVFISGKAVQYLEGKIIIDI